MRNFIVWPDRNLLHSNLPSCFQNLYYRLHRNIYSVNLTAPAQTYSNYKSRNTVKYLIGITPAGAISFLSAGWGGRASDKMITVNSGFLYMLYHGDCVLADRGFLVEEFLHLLKESINYLP